MAKTSNSLSQVQAAIKKLTGEELAKMSDMQYDVPRIPTGVTALDYKLQGGLPKGKIALAWGAEGSGKSALATQFAGQAQQEGQVVYIDLENSLDPAKAENSGVNMEELLISQPATAEQTLEIIELCLGTDDISAIIVDSVAAMATEAEINGDFGDAHVAELARLMSKGLKKINNFMTENDSDTILFFINQQRETINSGGFGTSKTTPGGKALRYYSSTTMELARIENLSQTGQVIGQRSQVTLKKSRYCAPFQKATFDILFESGISNDSFIFDQAVQLGRLEKGGGGWVTDTATGEVVAQGKPNFLDYLKENPEYAQELSDLVITNT